MTQMPTGGIEHFGKVRHIKVNSLDRAVRHIYSKGDLMTSQLRLERRGKATVDLPCNISLYYITAYKDHSRSALVQHPLRQRRKIVKHFIRLRNLI